MLHAFDLEMRQMENRGMGGEQIYMHTHLFLYRNQDMESRSLCIIYIRTVAQFLMCVRVVCVHVCDLFCVTRLIEIERSH